jgi:lipoprotein-releasing system permease protein
MKIEFFLARRIALGGQHSFSRIIIRIAAVAVAISVAVMIISTALITGFKKEISSKIFGFWGHIHVTQTGFGNSLLDTPPLEFSPSLFQSIDTIGRLRYFEEIPTQNGYQEREGITRGGVAHLQVYALKAGIIQAKEDIEGIILKGIGSDFNWKFLNSYIKEGSVIDFPDSVASTDILISQQTANRLKLELNQSLIVHFIQQGEQLRRRFTVKGIYKTGLEEYDRQFALVDIRQIQQLLGWRPTQVSGLEIFVEDLQDARPLADHIYFNILPSDLYAEPIRQKLPEIFEWLDLQDINEVVILVLMVIVAVINMITALMILILERTNMIGTLKALGATNWNIQKMFLYHAAYIIILGLVLGNLLGLGICWMQDTFEFIRLSEENYYLATAPIAFNMWGFLMINLGTLLVTLVFLLIPTFLVLSISPVKAIRFK